MKRNQTLHEKLIPLIVEGIGARSYLEFGTHLNETISGVRCEKRYGVDINPIVTPGVHVFQMTTAEFIENHAAQHAPFDVVFIDADHSAESVRSDFFGIIDHVSADGLILLHDTNPETVVDTHRDLCGDAWKFAEVLWNDQYEAVTLPYHPGLTIVRLRRGWGPQI